MASRTQTLQRKPATKKRAPVSRPAKSRAATRKPRRSAASRAATSAKLPGWSDLAGKKNKATKKKSAKGVKPGLVDGVPTLRFAVLLVAACALFTLYVGHIYATQALVADVQTLRKDNLRLVLKHNRLRGEFDRMTSPTVILDRAAALGLAPSGDYAPTIHLTQD